MSRLSSLLKYYREKSDLSQQQIANVLNIDRSTYTYYETGKTVPSAATIIKISKILNVDYVEFFSCVNDEMYSETYVSDVKSYMSRKSDKKKSSDKNIKIYDLSKDEQELLMRYRVLDADGKESIMDMITEKTMTRKKSESKKNQDGKADKE